MTNTDPITNPAPRESSILPDIDIPEFPKEERLVQAMQAWKDAKGKLSLCKAVRQYDVPRNTLKRRLNGGTTAKNGIETVPGISS